MTDQDRFNKAVMNWISEATSLLQYRSDGGQRILAAACGECWAAFAALNHDAAPAAKAPTDSAGEPGGGHGSDRTDKAVTRPVMGTGDIPCSRTRDICERLRTWCHAVKAESAQDLMDEAADEIERLRLTDEEREAIRFAAVFYAQGGRAADAATLRNLLERLA